jgi:hypothetical protein
MPVNSMSSPRGFMAALTCHCPLLSASEPVTYLDVDDVVRATFGYAKGADYGCQASRVSTRCSRRSRRRPRRR